MAKQEHLIRLELDPEGGPLSRLFGGGRQYAMLYPELRHGTSRAVEAANRKYLKYSEKTVSVAEGQPLSEAIKGVTVELDLQNVDFTEANDLFILGQVAEWSMGPVTQEVLDNLPERVHDVILKRCDELYKSPLPKSGGKG